MGLAASQARLLSITQRLSDNELRAQLINNQKMRLSAESSQVSENYINALNKTHLMFANYDAQDKAQTVPLTFNNLTAFNQYNNQYGLTNTAGNILISEDQAKKYSEAVATDKPLEEFLRLYGIEETTSYWKTVEPQLADAGIGYTAAQLREMYEGNPAATPPIFSYATTIKTQEYTDFSGYLDDFIRAKADYDNAIAKATKELLNGIGNTKYTVGGRQISLNEIVEYSGGDSSKDPSFFFGSNCANLKDLLTQVLTANSKSGSDVTGFINEHFDTNGYKKGNDNLKLSGSTYTASGNYESLGLTNTSLLSTTEANKSALTYTSGTNKYICIGPVTTDDDGNAIVGWVRMDDAGSSSPDLNIYSRGSDGTMTVIKAKDETGTDEDGNSTDGAEVDMKIKSKSSSAGSFTYKMDVDYTDSSGNLSQAEQTTKITYPTSGTKVSDGSGTKVELSGDKKGMSEEIGAVLNTLLQDAYAFLRANLKNFDPSSSSDPNVQAALTACIGMAQNLLNTIIGTNTDGSNIVNVDATNIDDLYEYIMKVVDGEATSSDPCLGHNPVENFRNVVNAYILDCVMDIFGEPVYQYLYTDGAVNDGNFETGEVKERYGNSDATAEAQWLTNLFNKIQDCGYQVLAKGLASSADWLQFALENGIVVMEQVTQDNSWLGITYSSCSDISEQTAKNEEAIAEAEYNKAMRQIQAKDEMFDLELKNIDTEHSSLQNEYESVKKAMSGNIERNFQMYG